jgi:hypothetical protein
MKINDSNMAGIGATDLSRAQGAEPAGAGGRGGAVQRGGGAGQDRVELSPLAAALTTLAADSAERSARVDELAAEYAAGRYEPDADETSRALVADAQRKGI